MEYGEVGFPDIPLHTQTYAHRRRNLTGSHLSLQEALNESQVGHARQNP